MKTVRIQENKRSHKSLIDAKEAFLLKLRAALDAENSIAGAITRVERSKRTSKRGAETKEDRTFGYFDNFVRHVNDAHRHQKNAEKIQTLIDANTAELSAMREARDEKSRTVKTVRTLNIFFRNGIIAPTEPVADPEKYHWEMQGDVSCHPTSWSQIGETGDTDIRPNLSSGEVRLSYDNGDLVSNKIKLVTVIKRQAAAAKRRQYRYDRDDAAFIQRCRGVAGRIQRMLKPGRLISDANFATRVFQDRVIQLPQHLESDVRQDTDPVTYGPRRLKSMTLYIAELCESGDTDDDDYVHMIEFMEPTIYLNPRGLHDALTSIYEGRRIALRLPVGERVEEEEELARPDILERTRRQGILDKKRRQAARMKKAAKLEADNVNTEKRAAAAERERMERASTDRQRQADREAEEARLRQEELKRVERDRKANADRIVREKAQAKATAAAEAGRIRKEQEEAAIKAAEDAARLEEERKRLQRQAEVDAVEYALPDNFKGFIQTYATKKEGTEKAAKGDWFNSKNKGSFYKKGKSSRPVTIAEANAEGWYEKATLDQEAADAAAAVLAAEEARLAKEKREAEEEAEAERQRLEQERQQKEVEAKEAVDALTAEAARLEAEAQAEHKRIAKEAVEAAAAARQAKIDVVRSDEDAMEFLHYVFTTYDTNANDEIDELELVKAYFTDQTKVKAGRGRVLIDENDEDGDGVIKETEFINWCAVTGVMDDDAWKAAARDFKQSLAAAAVGSGEQKSSGENRVADDEILLISSAMPFFIGEVEDILAQIGSDPNEGAWNADNGFKEVTKKIRGKTFDDSIGTFLNETGADAWLTVKNLKAMNNSDDFRIFYVPERPDKGFAWKAADLRFINAKAICTMKVEENTFKAKDGSMHVRKIFILKDIATKERGAKFLFAKALGQLREDNPGIPMVITQPLRNLDIDKWRDDEGYVKRRTAFVKWGFQKLKSKPPPSPGITMLVESDTEELWAAKPGDLSAMIDSMSADWVSSDEELMDFAEASEGESMEFAASSSLDTDSDLDFAQSSERSAHPLSSEEESSEKGKNSSGMEFAESSAAETDSDLEFAETSEKTSSGLEFAESSAVESD